ncbi:hypothetical protein [Vibrio metschnikovii]|uniref:capsular polysaccharide export protein, LipB/KpsS family n=1 Tax=Vibrio metschnikovii TaxID=28172 RepID=UPI00315D05AA
MERIIKTVKKPLRYIKRRMFNQARIPVGRQPIFVVGFSTWKQYLRKYFSENELIFLPKDISESEFNLRFKKQILNCKAYTEVFIWGFKAPDYILKFLSDNQIKTKFVEDGFVRSVQLGATKAPPMSLCLDSVTPYFDATKASELETLLSTFDFKGKDDLLKRSKAGIELLCKTGVSKYNNSAPVDVTKLYGAKNKTRILVLGQVEDDASILFGCQKRLTNNDVVRLAVKENPDAQVIYKPHPDVINGHRPYQSNPRDVADICTLITNDVPLANALETVDHVYTITSLGGFEALLRGIKVTVLGCPFYAGWGLTDDRQPNERRTRQLTLEQLFAVAYLTYPKYFEPETGNKVNFEDVVNTVCHELNLKVNVSDNIGDLKSKTTSSTSKPTETKVKEANIIPNWYQPHLSRELESEFLTERPVVLYMPWIAEHGDVLISKIRSDNDYKLLPFDLIRGIDPLEMRRDILKFARENPDVYRRMVARRLIPLKSKVKGFILTFDWAPVMRVIANVCQELEIPIILIPHESVFVDRQKYYWDVTSQASVPSADVVLSWGKLQKEIFVERGYPAERVLIVGAPKFDCYFNYKPQLTRKQFSKLYGLSDQKDIVLFAAQPLDSQINARVARESQRAAINDLLDVAEELGVQVIIRMPPSKDNILNAALRLRISNSDFAAIDDSICYLVSAEESIYHSKVVTSINSTMLFEGVLMGRAALSLKYVNFEQIWEKAGIPAVINKDQLREMLNYVITGNSIISKEGYEWASNQFSVGEFDGCSAKRIRQHLQKIVHGVGFLPRKSAIERVLSNEPIDVMAIPSSVKVWNGVQKHLQAMLKARQRVNSSAGIKNLKLLAGAEIFVQWGITPNLSKQNQRDVALALGKPVLIVEDGFIRSLDIGLSGEPALSILLDDRTAYYDAKKESKLQSLLSSEIQLTDSQFERSREAISKIRQYRISKYNHAPDYPVKIGRVDSHKVLLIDQRFGDQSVESGLASEASFDQMLEDALRDNPESDIIIKQHPDAIKGGKSSYFSDKKMAFTKHMPNVFLVNYDLNPHALFDLVDEVYVATSGMGFEALMAGKKVHCYGVPFYSGWGVTNDKVKVKGRNRQRTIEEIFYFSYINLSRYFNPDRNDTCEIEELISYIHENKK